MIPGLLYGMIPFHQNPIISYQHHFLGIKKAILMVLIIP